MLSTDLTKEQWITILNDSEVTKNENLELLEFIYSHSNHRIVYKQKSKSLKDPRIPTHQYADRIMSKYSKEYNVELKSEGKLGKGQWWLIFNGWYDGKLWVWSLKPNLIEAIKEMHNINSYNLNNISEKGSPTIEQRYVRIQNGVYLTKIDITVEEWKTMLLDKNIFTDASIDMIYKWYLQDNQQATCGEIKSKYYNEYGQLDAVPFNGIVKGLGKRILKYLNRFELTGVDGRPTYWIVVFEGWHETNQYSKGFIWKLRSELINAIEELGLFDETDIPLNNELESIIYREGEAEGKKTLYFTTKYERSQKNRSTAIRLHGLTCRICGFNFENTYGELGRNYIEVHHLKPLYSLDEEVKIDCNTDLVCVCSNCHRMLHRKSNYIISPDELKVYTDERKDKPIGTAIIQGKLPFNKDDLYG